MQKNESGLVVVCSAVNVAGSDSSRARLTVTSSEDLPPPVIELGPANQTLPLHTMASLTCLASGSPPPVLTWYKDDTPVLRGTARVNITDSGTLHINGGSRRHSSLLSG